MRPEELSLAALGQLCPQHQAWANSFPRPCAAMVPGAQRDTSAPSCTSESRESPGKVPASDSGGSGGHRHTGLPSWWHRVISTAWVFQNLEKIGTCKPAGGKEKLLRKVSPTKVNSGNKCNFPGDPAPVFAQVCYLHAGCNNKSGAGCTALRKKQDSSNFTHLLQQKADWHFCTCCYSAQAIKYMWFVFTTFSDLPFCSTSCPVLHSCTLDKFCLKLATETKPGFGLKNFPVQKSHSCIEVLAFMWRQ